MTGPIQMVILSTYALTLYLTTALTCIQRHPTRSRGLVHLKLLPPEGPSDAGPFKQARDNLYLRTCKCIYPEAEKNAGFNITSGGYRGIKWTQCATPGSISTESAKTDLEWRRRRGTILRSIWQSGAFSHVQLPQSAPIRNRRYTCSFPRITVFE
ncbi:hypothetical protein C8Q70DRAFT_250139 [Cubamyces menziesii]|nr:hypothetical protein C8Q70DRAFT_250139 [Cubamyces menziesii]